MLNKIKEQWDSIQSLLDIDGDVWMGLFTTIILLRIYLVLKGYAPLTKEEAGAYSVCVGAFAYSNKQGPKI